jgi:hypothetical protein
MSRIDENEIVRKQIDDMLNDQELLTAILINPNKAMPILMGTSLHLLYDISKSLAVIADGMHTKETLNE